MPADEAARRARVEFGNVAQRQGRLPGGPRPAAVRRARPQPALRRPALLRKTPGLHRQHAGDARALPRLQPHHLRRRRLGAAPAAAVPGAGRPGERLQHLSAGRRAERRLLADQLLRAARPHRRVRRRLGLPRGHGDRRRARRNRTRARDPRVAGLLRDAGPRAGAGARVHRRGDDLSDAADVAILTRRLLAAAPQRATPASIGRHDPRRRLRTRPSSACCRAEFSFLSSKATLYLPLASSPEERAARNRHSGNSRHDRAAEARASRVAEAQAQIDAHNAALEASNPDAAAMAEAGFRSIVVPLHADHVAGVRELLLLLQAGVAPAARSSARSTSPTCC